MVVRTVHINLNQSFREHLDGLKLLFDLNFKIVK